MPRDTRNVHAHLLFNQPWIAGAKPLLDAGYELVRLGPERLIPAYFTMSGREPVYLFRPILDKTYTYEPAMRYWAEIENGLWRIEYIPTEDFDPRNGVCVNDARPWVPRLWSTYPSDFDNREAAEHCGLSLSAVKAGIYRATSNRLAPDRRKTGKRCLMYDEATLIRWVRQKGIEAHVSERYMHRSLLEITSKGRLVTMTQRAIEDGRLTPQVIVAAAASAVPGAAGELGIAAYGRDTLDGFMARAEQLLPRSVWINILAVDDDQGSLAAVVARDLAATA